MKREQKALFQYITPSGKSPHSRVSDVFLLSLIELGPRGNVKQEQLPSLVGFEESLVRMLRRE
jgi:hypothetical protein